jgi:hypothetical protein
MSVNANSPQHFFFLSASYFQLRDLPSDLGTSLVNDRPQSLQDGFCKGWGFGDVCIDVGISFRHELIVHDFPASSNKLLRVQRFSAKV